MGYFLPIKYKELHNLCFYLHNILAQVVIEGEKKKLLDTVIKLKKITILRNFKIVMIF